MQDYFDTIFCINLDRRTDRWAEAQAEMRRTGLTKCLRFSAFERENASAGCASSHRHIWDWIGRGLYGDRVLILEDDFSLVTISDLRRAGFSVDSDVARIFNEPSVEATTDAEWLAKRFAIMVSEVPDDWDAIYLGGSYERKPIGRVSRHVIQTAGMHTTHAYALTKRSAALMTEILDRRASRNEYIGGIDSILCGYAQSMKFYTLSPRLFIQRPSPSDINPAASIGFSWSQTDAVHEMMV